MTRGEARQRLLDTAERMGARHVEIGKRPFAGNTPAYLTSRVALAAGLSIRQSDNAAWAREVAAAYDAGRLVAERRALRAR